MKKIKIAITGPESSGKTTLAKKLSTNFKKSILVNEFAREYLKTVNGKYTYSDLIKIAKGQKEREFQASKK